MTEEIDVFKASAQAVYKQLALEFKRDYEEAIAEIKTFEEIFNNKRYNQITKTRAKEILELLYKHRDSYAKKAEFYRKMYQYPERAAGDIGWGKGTAV